MNKINLLSDGASSGLALGSTEMVPEDEAPTNLKQENGHNGVESQEVENK